VGWRHTKDGSRKTRAGRRRRKEEKRVVKKRSKTIRCKTFKKWTSSSDALSLHVQTLKNRLYPSVK